MAHGGSALRYEPMYEEEIETEDQYDDSGFSYELEECDLDLDEGIVLQSSSPFDYTVGVHVTPCKEGTESESKRFVTSFFPEAAGSLTMAQQVGTSYLKPLSGSMTSPGRKYCQPNLYRQSICSKFLVFWFAAMVELSESNTPVKH